MPVIVLKSKQAGTAPLRCESYDLEGPMDSIVADSTITVLGITFGIDGDTSMPVTMPVTGDIVKVVDSDGDGIADSVEIED